MAIGLHGRDHRSGAQLVAPRRAPDVHPPGVCHEHPGVHAGAQVLVQVLGQFPSAGQDLVGFAKGEVGGEPSGRVEQTRTLDQTDQLVRAQDGGGGGGHIGRRQVEDLTGG